MHRQIVLLTFLLAVCSAFAQTTDGFGDGDFTSAPAWNGDDSLFRVNVALQLQSKGSVSKDIYLSTSSVATQEAEWSVWCRFNLSPSTSNFCRFYLTSDSPGLKGSLNGYYVQFGGVTGSFDSITLYKQKGTTRTRIIGGRPATVSKSSNQVRVKVIRDNAGHWQLYADTTGGTGYILEGSGTDTEFTTGNYIGFFVRYTSGNASNYFFDDVYTGPVIIDTLPPQIDSVNVISATQLSIVFNEQVNSTALNPLNYTINNGIGNPLSAVRASGKWNTILLDLAIPLTNNNYLFGANNIADLAGNINHELEMPFNYYVFTAQEYDLLISEFFPDPSPQEDLPEHEFIELYNRTSSTIPLKNWTISDGSSTAVLPDIVLGADSMIIICSAAHVAEFSLWGRTAGVSSFPSLNNSGDMILLKDNTGKEIHRIEYDLGWYADKEKDNGGWTIEMNNPLHVCKGSFNFGASDHIEGGTPGTFNSRWNVIPDTVAPVVKHITALSDSLIAVVFSEPMDSIFLQESLDSISGISIVKKQFTGNHSDTLLLSVYPPLDMNISYTISISGEQDCSQNRAEPVTMQFTRFVPDKALSYDVLINEIMPDPDPALALPAAEYIELYNRSHRIISLKNWTLSDAGAQALLPDYILLPDSFLIVTSAANAGQFSAYHNVIGIDGFPSLGNDGDALTLADDRKRVIHHIAYTSSFFKDVVKKNGGWSLELIDKRNPCGGQQNFTASTNAAGGTPGRANATRSANPDEDPPKLLRAYPLNENEVKLTFSESIDSTSMLDIFQFYANNGSVRPTEAYLKGPAYHELILSFPDPLLIQTSYRIIADSVKDCAGNYIEYDNYADFGIPEAFDSFDIAVNEILFDPKAGGTDFVEIYNRTEKMIDLRDIYIANADADGQVNNFYPVAADGFLLFPHSYVVITEDPFAVQSQYFTPNPKNVIQCKMPSFNDYEGKCILMDASGKRYDQLNYDDNMHFALIDDKAGVSLERIDFNRSAKDYSNWTSASSTSGFGTPTYRNSQYAKGGAGDDMLKIQPEVFSPDGDGYNDVITFNYALSKPGYVGNLYIYDGNGVMVKHLLRNEILGTTGSFSWDGITDEMDKAAIGIYICYFEVFNLKGNISKKKKTIVVGGKL